MFKCGLCNESSEPRESPVMVVLETRAKTYTIRDDSEEGFHITTGSEIVKEVAAHRECAAKRNG